MHSARWSRALFFGLAALACVSASVAHDTTARSPQRRHEDEGPMAVHSNAHVAPLLELNETEILEWHAPDPMSYWDHDHNSDDGTNVRGLMTLHIIGMSFAFFILLPVGIAFRSVKHPWHSAVAVSFGVATFLSSAAGSLYKKLTGDLYEGSIHGRHGYVVLALVAVLAFCDAFTLLRRAATFLRGPDRKNIRLLWRSVVLNQDDHDSNEYASLVHDEPEEYVEAKLAAHDEDETKVPPRSRIPEPIDTSHGHASEWVNQEEWPQSSASHRTLVNHSFHPRHHSEASDDTLHTPTFSRTPSLDSNHSQVRRPWPTTVLLAVSTAVHRFAFPTAERVLVVLAFMQLLSGITVYTGICRQNWINGCMAHLIKGGIFWCYGLLSFGRYLGAWADLGWAWNRLPGHRARNIPSAEMVECFVIFLYGATNTWMERFGAAPGSAFTTKQVQHISIAVMFWFAGLLGIALESKVFRRWLAAPAHSIVKADDTIAQPPSYRGSFNPFPALVIGVTGAAMSAHHQKYLFQVQIHALWGYFLTAFAMFRFLTYFFLWLRPPHSVLPSRPPTEALASFCLASGGLVFILSTEQITFAAMRRGHDDVMLFFNFAVAVTSLVLCWLLSITAFKGWVTSRAARPTQPNFFSRRVVFDTDVRIA